MNALRPTSEAEMEESLSFRANASEEDLLELLELADKTIKTLEKRITMQERTYANAMQDKNQKIRDLQLCLQSKC